MTLDPGKDLSAQSLTTSDGRTLRYVTGGEGGPLVVFEAGLGSCASMWVATQRLVSESTRTLSYDRAGHAGSTPDTQPRSLARICEDLHALVEHASPGEPVVLVAHSWGGPIVRCYSDLHPERVAGVVLIDTSTTDNFPPKAAKRMPSIMSFMRVLHAVGVAKPVLRRSVYKNFGPDISPADRAVIDRDLTSVRSAKAAVGEAKAILPSLPLMARWEEDGLPDVPVINVMGGGTVARSADLRAKYIADVEKEMANHPQGECRVIEGTDHFIPQDKPRETAQAILDVVQKARQA
jgi:pimeloyl-ACP methyl ester carboxylesterase